MRAIKKLSRSIATALFTVALGDTFDWVQSVPAGERPRYSPRATVAGKAVAPTMDVWRPSAESKPAPG